MKALLVGFGFKARHGKDTVASKVAAQVPGARIFAFADDLKALARALGMTEKNGPFLQKLGEAMRTLDPLYWVKRLEARIEESGCDLALIPDMRHENEARWIAQHGGLAYRIDRTNADGSPYVAPDRDPTHVSETQLEGKALFDMYFVVKSGDFGKLNAVALDIVRQVRERLARRAGLLTAADVKGVVDSMYDGSTQFKVTPYGRSISVTAKAAEEFACATGGEDVAAGSPYVFPGEAGPVAQTVLPDDVYEARRRVFMPDPPCSVCGREADRCPAAGRWQTDAERMHRTTKLSDGTGR